MSLNLSQQFDNLRPSAKMTIALGTPALIALVFLLLGAEAIGAGIFILEALIIIMGWMLHSR